MFDLSLKVNLETNYFQQERVPPHRKKRCKNGWKRSLDTILRIKVSDPQKVQILIRVIFLFGEELR